MELTELRFKDSKPEQTIEKIKKCLAEVGITPDVLVPVEEETASAIYYGTLDPREDPQVQAAIKALK